MEQLKEEILRSKKLMGLAEGLNLEKQTPSEVDAFLLNLFKKMKQFKLNDFESAKDLIGFEINNKVYMVYDTQQHSLRCCWDQIWGKLVHEYSLNDEESKNKIIKTWYKLFSSPLNEVIEHEIDGGMIILMMESELISNPERITKL